MDQGLSIQEVAARTGVSAHTLRYYERIGLLAHVGRAVNGHRRYTESDLGWVRFLLLLRSTGMPIQKMQQFTELERQGPASIGGRRALLDEHRQDVQERMEELQRHLEYLERKVAYYRAREAEIHAASGGGARHAEAGTDRNHCQ